jgi:CubicO group peptidase (beta-lactamase class C family)
MVRIHVAVICILAGVLGCASHASSELQRLTIPAGEARLDSIVRDVQQKIGIPAISVAIVDRGRIVYSRSLGVADLEHGVSATETTGYRTASVAKPITAAAVLQLVATGRLDLDESIRSYIPELPAAYGRVTLRDLLRHTGGVRHYRSQIEFITTAHCDNLIQALPIFAFDSLEHEPSERITYSSYGYTLLGLAVERVSGLPYPEYVQVNIFDPAGMTNTRVDDSGIIPNRGRGYVRGQDGALRNAPALNTSCRVPAGGFVSTANDLASFVVALDAGALLDSAWVHEMTTSQLTSEMIVRTLEGLEAPPGFQPPGMGFGWAVEPDGTSAYHGGTQPGFTSMLYYVPGERAAAAVMVNLEGGGDALTDLARRLLAAYRQLD